jgi:hypothetical protein
MESSVFYLDWNFWTAVLAAVAIALSQLPPIKLWFRKAKIDFELHSRISITHKVGNPNLQLHVLVSNIGGKKVKIKEINARIENDSDKQIVIPSQTYLQTSDTKNGILFTTFSIDQGGEWSHIINLFNSFSREDEKEYRNMQKEMRIDLINKLKAKKEEIKNKKAEDDSEELVELDNKYIDQSKSFFQKHFFWNPGEYKMTIDVITDQSSANLSKTFRFTIFEVHTDQMKLIVDRYKYGEDILYSALLDNIPEAILDIKEV